ncbi:MAG: WD40/YVTN/BNR-like repeat-containing protein [Phycisphaerae bacterium]
MTSIRVLVGTRKGAFILSSDAKREKWKVDGPLFSGWEIFHMKGSPADPNRIFASQSSGWFGQIIQRSSDGGKTWETPGGGPEKSPQGWPKGESNKFVYDTSPETGQPITTHQWYDGSQHPWDFKRVWHLEPSLTDPDTCYAGIEDAALFKTSNGGQTWNELAGLRAAKGNLWSPGAGGLCLHTIVLDPANPNRITIAISAAGAFRTDDAGKTWKPINKGLRNDYLPDPTPEIGFCVHHIAMNPARPNTLFMQLHQGGGAYRSDNAGDSWTEVKGNLPSDFGFPIDVHAHEPDTVFILPLDPMVRVPLEGKLAVWRSKTGGNEWEPMTKGLPQKDCYVNVLRDAMAVDKLDPCGVYFGTTGGQVYVSPDGGDSWKPIVHDLPAVLSVEVQTY